MCNRLKQIQAFHSYHLRGKCHRRGGVYLLETRASTIQRMPTRHFMPAAAAGWARPGAREATPRLAPPRPA